MKVLLFDIKAHSCQKKCINKDLAGGMGTGTWIGDSLRARIFEYVKKKNVILPVMVIPYLAAIFKRAGWQVELVKAEKGKNFSIETADLALVPSSIVDCVHEIEVIKEIKNKGIYVGVYGTFASAVPEFFTEFADFIIKGEPESGALKIVDGETLPKGILEVELTQNLDGLPFPDWSQFPVKNYSYTPALNKKPVLTMLSSRGCPYSCSFYCPYPINSGNKWRIRSIKNVIDEIVYLKKNYGIRAIDFRDPVFTLSRERTLEFADELKRNNLDIIWSCETRLDRLDKELIKKMCSAGLRNLNVGIESSSVEVLEGSQRLPIEYRHQEEIISYCDEVGVNVAAFYILGLESDTERSINTTIEYAKKLNTLVAQFAVCTPYPGTRFFEKMKKDKQIMTFDWENYDEYTPIFRHNSLSAERLLALKEKAFNSYYFRLAYFFKHGIKILKNFLWQF